MADLVRKVAFKGSIILSAAAIFALLVAVHFTGISSASVSGTVSASTSVISDCFVSLQPNSIGFGAIIPGSNVPTNVVVTDMDVNGNIASNMIISANNWNDGGLNSFGVTNTMWSPTSLSYYGGTPLTISAVDTGIVIPSPTLTSPTTSNVVYFGLAIPVSIAPTTYTQIITITNSC